jgi:hypothetical protein
MEGKSDCWCCLTNFMCISMFTVIIFRVLPIFTRKKVATKQNSIN